MVGVAISVVVLFVVEPMWRLGLGCDFPGFFAIYSYFFGEFLVGGVNGARFCCVFGVGFGLVGF